MKIDYRRESFLAFLKTQGFPAGMWVMSFFGLLMVSGVAALDLRIGRFPTQGMVLLVLFCGLYLFINWSAYSMYKRGRKIALSASSHAEEIIENVVVLIKNFNFLGRRQIFPPDMSKTLYDFDRADIILKENSLILLGFGGTFFGKLYATPVELMLSGTSDQVIKNNVKIVSIHPLSDGRPELTIEDPNYGERIKVVLEDREEIKLWLTTPKRQSWPTASPAV